MSGSLPEFHDRAYFESLQKKLFPLLKTHEHLFLTLAAESSQFVRLNGLGGAPRIRQIGTVSDAMVELKLVFAESSERLRSASRAVTLTGIGYIDQAELLTALEVLQKEARELPLDPFAQLPSNHGLSSTETRAQLPSIEDAPSAILDGSHDMDLAGIYASGPSVRAMADSAGTFHWFSTETFGFDYSIYTPEQRAVKGMYAGRDWEGDQLRALIHHSAKKAELLRKPGKRLSPGGYRVFLEADALSDLVKMLSWGAIGEASIRQGDSPLQKLRSGAEKFSSLFTLSEDFKSGEVPRFNSEGELAPQQLPLFDRGEPKNTLISTRTAREYGLSSNFANESESLRAPSLSAGNLRSDDILARLESGIYVSNVHYLNWSDQPGGRITGMTRYACFWVERGEIICPIENLRFDDTIFRMFGSSLEALTETREFLAESSTYGMRALGGIWSPGALLSEMKFTI